MEEKSKNGRSPGEQRNRLLLRAVLILIPIIVCGVLYLVTRDMFRDKTPPINYTGEQAGKAITGLMFAVMPESATDMTYHEVRTGFDPYDATATFKVTPEEYLDFIADAEPFCFATPLSPEGNQPPAPRNQCDGVSMNITVDKTDPALWQVTIVVHSFH